MNYLTVYDPETGEILETHKSPGVIRLVGQEGKSFVEEEGDITRQFVKGGRVVDRPEMAVTLDGAILRGVPSGASVVIDGVAYAADGTDIELSFSLDVDHTIKVILWPFMPVEVTYEN